MRSVRIDGERTIYDNEYNPIKAGSKYFQMYFEIEIKQ